MKPFDERGASEMLNLELARIVTAERRRETDQAVRLSPLRIALRERLAELKARASPVRFPTRSESRPGHQAGPRAVTLTAAQTAA